MLKGQQRAKQLSTGLCKTLVSHHESVSKGRNPCKEQVCLAEHTRVTCHRAIRTSCHEHNAHPVGWHLANWVQSSLPLHWCASTCTVAQTRLHKDHVHLKTQPPAHSPCINTDGCMQSKHGHASFACPAAEVAQLGCLGSVQTQHVLEMQKKPRAELSHSSKMCQLPRHQTKGN